jgi:hypothetical protein
LGVVSEALITRNASPVPLDIGRPICKHSFVEKRYGAKFSKPKRLNKEVATDATTPQKDAVTSLAGHVELSS